jgi:hypothetical protein
VLPVMSFRSVAEKHLSLLALSFLARGRRSRLRHALGAAVLACAIITYRAYRLPWHPAG